MYSVVYVVLKVLNLIIIFERRNLNSKGIYATGLLNGILTKIPQWNFHVANEAFSVEDFVIKINTCVNVYLGVGLCVKKMQDYGSYTLDSKKC